MTKEVYPCLECTLAKQAEEECCAVKPIRGQQTITEGVNVYPILWMQRLLRFLFS